MVMLQIKNVLGHMAKDVFATLNYSKMHITVNANKNTKLTPTALNIVIHLHELHNMLSLATAVVKVISFLCLLLYHLFVFCIQYSAKFFRNLCNSLEV